MYLLLNRLSLLTNFGAGDIISTIVFVLIYRYANEGLYYYVQKNYGPLNNEGSGVDSFTMQIPRGDQ